MVTNQDGLGTAFIPKRILARNLVMKALKMKALF
jgi:hypothetical protein